MNAWTERLKRWGAAYQQWSESARGKLVARIARWAFFAGIVAWLVLKVRAIGWEQVWHSLPTNPWFYILFVIMFLALPVSETFIFRMILGGRIMEQLPVFIRKRVLNSAFVGYSGEVYYLVWAREHLSRPVSEILLRIKDNAILSAIGSALVTFALLVGFLFTGQAGFITKWLASSAGMVIGVVLVCAVLAPVALMARKAILGLPWRQALAVLAIHVSRVALLVVLQATQWAVVLPEQPWGVWLTFVTLQMIISRLPIVPNRDLLFLSAGLELSHAMNTPSDAMAGLLLAGGALTQGSNLLFFILTSFGGMRKPAPEPDIGPTHHDPDVTLQGE